MSNKKSFFQKINNWKSKAAIATTALASNVASAVDDTVVTAAQTAGEGSVLNAANGLIAIVAIVVGLSMVIMLLRKA